jgi:Domain of Unknown Function (DUF1080)
MSQYPEGGRDNPNNPNPSNPQYPPTPDAGPPPSEPNPGYNQPSSDPNSYGNLPANTPNSSSGSSSPTDPTYTPPPMSDAQVNPPTPMPPGTEPNSYDPSAQTVMGQQPSDPAYPGHNPISGPGLMTMPPPMQASQPTRRQGRTVLLASIALILIIGASIIGVTTYNNNQHNLHVSATATATAVTATAIASNYPFSNKLVLDDPLVDNSKGVNWDDNPIGGCFFAGSAYHVVDSQAGTYNVCAATGTDYKDFTFQVQMVIKSGDDSTAISTGGGLIFRADEANAKYYRLSISQQGFYDLLATTDGTGANARSMDHGTASQFATGLGQTNTIAVVVRGDQISFYINDQLVTPQSITDTAYTHGQIGFMADGPLLPFDPLTTEVLYTNLKVWQL